MNSTLKILTIALSTGLAAGCAAIVNDADDALTYMQEHPISVDSQVVTLTLNGDTNQLSKIDVARLNAFANAYQQDGHGTINITTPASGSKSNQKLAAAARDVLYHAGVMRDSIGASNYVPNQSNSSDIIISYTHYVATPSACGIWAGLREREQRNTRSPNFGCATQNNLAAMIGDPRDLVAPPTLADADSEFRIRGVELFRQGSDTGSEAGDIDASTGAN